MLFNEKTFEKIEIKKEARARNNKVHINELQLTHYERIHHKYI